VLAKLSRSLTIALAFCLASSVLSAAGRPPKTSTGSSDSSSESTLPSGRGALRQIVQDQCVINWQQHHDPDPCERVVLAGKGSDVGYALLGDPGGGAHYLLVPTQAMAGTESGELLDPDAPNYFADAWHARELLSKFVGHEVPRAAIALVVNTARARAYDQYSIHIECLRQDVYDSLRRSAEQVTSVWAPLDVGGATFHALKIAGEGLDGANLYELLASLTPDTARHMGDYTLIAAGAQFKSGPGFIVLTGTGPSGEILLDSSCAAAGGGG